MRASYFHSWLLALLTSVSVTAIAAPAAKPAMADTHSTAAVVTAPQAVMIDLNSADAATLQRELSGVGQVKAKAIVAYREANGAFSSVDELLEVKGIGKAILESNRERLKVN